MQQNDGERHLTDVADDSTMAEVVAPENVDAEAAFAAFYGQSYLGARRLAHLLLSGSPDAEDVVQDVFARLHQRFDRLERPEAYLRVAVVNGCRQHRRAAQRRDHWLRIATAGADETTILCDPLLDAVAVLPFRQRAAIVLRYWSDLSDEEIGSALGTRPSTVRSLIHRGLRHLRQELSS